MVLFQDCFYYLEPHSTPPAIPQKCDNDLFLFEKKDGWNFDRDCVEFVDHFGASPGFFLGLLGLLRSFSPDSRGELLSQRAQQLPSTLSMVRW